MKKYIYNRMITAQAEAESSVRFVYKHCSAAEAHKDYAPIYKRIKGYMNIKSFPESLRQSVLYSFDQLWSYQITHEIHYPVVWEGRLYSKWKNYPDAAKQYCRDNSQGLPRIPVFNKDFTEGMKA